jgi:drug/metabolite transporter (DMT)-like permease
MALGARIAFVLIAFASNSLLTRAALATGDFDPPSFSLVRVAAGAAMLAVLARGRNAAPIVTPAPWTGAWSLAGYLIAFTLAYARIGASVGALLLFGAVHITMIAAGIARGERQRPADWLGASLALAGLLWLTLPGSAAPDLTGALLMIAAGLCWGAYSVVGRGSRDPLGDTARNFWRTTLLLALPLAAWAWPPAGTWRGVLFAITSGAVSSGLGYTVWYAVLPALSAVRAATLQLAVPVVTAIAASLLLGESITPRLGVSAAFVAAGVWLTTVKRSRT